VGRERKGGFLPLKEGDGRERREEVRGRGILFHVLGVIDAPV